MRQQQSDTGAETDTVHYCDGYFGKGSDYFSDMIGARFSAAIRAAVLAPFGRELRQISPRAISDVTGAGGQDYGDVLIVPELFEDREQLADHIPAQRVPLFRPIDGHLGHCVSRF